jgi:transposase
MSSPIAPDYGQRFLFPPELEDWISLDHPARFIREFVDQLDLGALGFAMPAGMEGRPPYAPSLHLKIWLYGYFNRIRSTRKLEAACTEHLPLLWLTGMIAPDHNSLWRFWRDNKKALRGVFKQTVELALRTGAVGLGLQALDGTKIAAAASSPAGWSKDFMEQTLAALDAALDDTELRIAQENSVSTNEPASRLPAGLAARQALREQIKQGLAQLQADGRKHYHPVEPEARRMKVGQGNQYAYNAQALADEKEGIVVACDVGRQENDCGQLAPMIEQARENTGAASAPLTVADTGYGSGADIKAAADAGQPVLVPPFKGGAKNDHAYSIHHFHFDPAARTVTCPQKRQLDHEGHTINEGVRIERYRCHCRDCPVRAQCTRDPKGRQIEIYPHTAETQVMRELLKTPAQAALLSRRREIIEKLFGHIKQHDGFRRWTVWGLDAVHTQWSIICATFNLRVLYGKWKRSQPTQYGPLGVGQFFSRKASAGLRTLCFWIKQPVTTAFWTLSPSLFQRRDVFTAWLRPHHFPLTPGKYF